MNIEIINKIDEIIELIKNDKDYIKMNQLENKLLLDKELLNNIAYLKNMNEFDNEYVELKKEVLNNQVYREYKELERDFYFFIHEINKKLNLLKETSGCK